MAAPVPMNSERARPIRVVLVDDSPEFLVQACDLVATTDSLEIAGTASSAREAFALLDRTPVALVLLDLHMPGMGGLAATKRIKQRGAGAPKVVIVTLHDGPEYRAAARSAGADGFLAKADLGSGLAVLLAALFTAPEANA